MSSCCFSFFAYSDCLVDLAFCFVELVGVEADAAVVVVVAAVVVGVVLSAASEPLVMVGETVAVHGWVSVAVVVTVGVLSSGLEAANDTAGSEIFSLILGVAATAVTREGEGGRSSDSEWLSLVTTPSLAATSAGSLGGVGADLLHMLTVNLDGGAVGDGSRLDDSCVELLPAEGDRRLPRRFSLVSFFFSSGGFFLFLSAFEGLKAAR